MQVPSSQFLSAAPVMVSFHYLKTQKNPAAADKHAPSRTQLGHRSIFSTPSEKLFIEKKWSDSFIYINLLKFSFLRQKWFTLFTCITHLVFLSLWELFKLITCLKAFLNMWQCVIFYALKMCWNELPSKEKAVLHKAFWLADIWSDQTFENSAVCTLLFKRVPTICVLFETCSTSCCRNIIILLVPLHHLQVCFRPQFELLLINPYLQLVNTVGVMIPLRQYPVPLISRCYIANRTPGIFTGEVR